MLVIGVVGALVAVLGMSYAHAGNSADVVARLDGFQEVPANVTTGNGSFRAHIDRDAREIDFTLRYRGLEGDASAAHIHLGQRNVNGGVAAFLCGGAKPACPRRGGVVTGTIRPADVIGPEAQGIAPGEFADLVRAIRAGVTYVNVHTSKFPNGEIRGQIRGADD
jgi:hypothetical protein